MAQNFLQLFAPEHAAHRVTSVMRIVPHYQVECSCGASVTIDKSAIDAASLSTEELDAAMTMAQRGEAGD